MANKKPALYYILVYGYHPHMPGRVMAVTSETKHRRTGEVVMLNGRDEAHGSSTRRNPRDVTYRFKDLDELRDFELDCIAAEAEVRARRAKVLRAHEHHRVMMMKFDKAKTAAMGEVHEAKHAVLKKLKGEA